MTEKIAVVGIAARLPGADDVDAFWGNLRDSIESVVQFGPSEAELVEPDIGQSPQFVGAVGELRDPWSFDASHFGLTPADATILDPQQRLFLELCVEAIDDAAFDRRDELDIGVYAGSDVSTYLLFYLLPVLTRLPHTLLQLLMANDKDHLPQRVSYKLGLTGPSIAVQTNCSSSLVAVHVAAQALRARECDVALAGGVSITLPQRAGYVYQEGSIGSSDGHCRAFSRDASGTVTGNGGGVVVLRLLADAIEQGDHIYGTIVGSAVNNDGANKIGYTASSVDAQRAVMVEALEVAGLTPADIQLIEAHGTGTPLGDPIELKALADVYSTGLPATTAVGTVKSNIGHLDSAAGVVGLLKILLAMKHRRIPASLHLDRPMAPLDRGSGHQLYAAQVPCKWRRPEGRPRRAAITSLGMGGTNVHMIVEEPPRRSKPVACRHGVIVPLSGKTERDVLASVHQLSNFVHERGLPASMMCSVASTLERGRRAFLYRRAVVLPGGARPGELPVGSNDRNIVAAAPTEPAVVFAFPGQASHIGGCARDLYKTFSDFRSILQRNSEAYDRCANVQMPWHLLTSSGEDADETDVVQPLLFVLELSLRDWLVGRGVQPTITIGHSLGEIAAWVAADAITPLAGMTIVDHRARCMKASPAGSMVAVAAPVAQVLPFIVGDLAITCINSPVDTVVGGPIAEVMKFARRLELEGLPHTVLRTSKAFHHPMMSEARVAFARSISEFPIGTPAIELISGYLGRDVAASDADPATISDQVDRPVQFADALGCLAEAGDVLVLELGPGTAISGLVRRHYQATNRKTPRSLALLPNRVGGSDGLEPLRVLARLWEYGLPVDLSCCASPIQRQRISLPSYPFDRQRMGVPLHANTTSRGGPSRLATNEPTLPRTLRIDVLDEPDGDSLRIAVMVQRIWAETLGIESLGNGEDVFALGADSLAATRVASRLAQSLGIDVPLRLVIEARTSERLTASLKERVRLKVASS
jgi:phthiocerol/phenolphthiocerol synthesis type-I polyketide synthase E